jgi:hypothetical protein
MHEEPSPHFLLTVRQRLNKAFVEKWIEVEAQSTGLPDPLTLILWIFGCGDT